MPEIGENMTCLESFWRRMNIQRYLLAGIAFFAAVYATWAQSTPQHPLPAPPPANVTSHAVLVSAKEPGKPLVVDGRVFAPDGVTAAAGVYIYAYNTDSEGYYSATKSFYPPRITGYVKTDNDGRFQIRTIMPGRYPGMRVPAHIHFNLWGGGYPFQYADEMRFEGDPYLTQEMVEADRKAGAFAMIRPITTGGNGVLHCTVNLKLVTQTNFSGVLPDYLK
jgi:protocatechuate 3,4-dioxygenase, beta subunit